MPPRTRLSIVPPTPSDRAPNLVDAVKASIAKMTWLTDSDDALKSLALRIAEEIEATVDRADELDAIYNDARGQQGGTDVYKRLVRLQAMCDVTETVAKLGPQLQAALRDLGGTPATRKALVDAAPVGNRLNNLRAAAKT